MGLYLRDGVWYARWVKRGRVQRRSLKTRDRREAELRFRKVAGRPLVRRPRRPRREVEADAERRRRIEWQVPPRTVGDMLDRWAVHVTKHAHVKRATIVTYSVHIRRWQARWGELRPGELTADGIRDWHAERADAVTTARVKCEVNVLRVWLKWCVEHGWIDRVPALPKVGGVPKKIPRALTPEQLRMLFDAVRVDHRPQVRALEPVLMVGLHAGLRREEIRFLAWSDVDLDEGFLRVTAKGDAFSPKNFEERMVPLSSELHEYLRRLRERRPAAKWVCESCELRQWSRRVSEWTRAAFEAAGISTEHGTLHRLRHSFCTMLLLGGIDLETVRDLAGHQDVSTTGRYLSTASERKRKAVEALDGLVQ